MISRREHDRQRAANEARQPGGDDVVMSEDEVIRRYQEIRDRKQHPADRAFALKELARVMDPVAYEKRQADMRALKAERDADALTTATCPYCKAKVPFVADGENECPKCHKELGVTLDPGMYEPSRMPESLPKP